MAEWNGHERREHERRNNWPCGVCAEHDVIQNGTKEHREIVCGKIAEVKKSMEQKADNKDLKGAMKVITILVGVCIAVVAGQAVWLKTDIMNVGSMVQRVNVRITEKENDRVTTEIARTQQLGEIQGELKNINWRITKIEEAGKPVNKFVPDK